MKNHPCTTVLSEHRTQRRAVGDCRTTPTALVSVDLYCFLYSWRMHSSSLSLSTCLNVAYFSALFIYFWTCVIHFFIYVFIIIITYFIIIHCIFLKGLLIYFLFKKNLYLKHQNCFLFCLWCWCQDISLIYFCSLVFLSPGMLLVIGIRSCRLSVSAF